VGKGGKEKSKEKENKKEEKGKERRKGNKGKKRRKEKKGKRDPILKKDINFLDENVTSWCLQGRVIAIFNEFASQTQLS